MIDSLQKWVDAYTTLMLVLVRVFPGRTVELIKYVQPYGGQILGAYLAQLRRAVSPSRRPRSVPELGSCDLEL